MLPAHKPRFEGVFHEFKRLLLNIRKARFFKVTDHVRRHSENSSYLVYLKFSCFKELCLFGRNTDGSVFHTLLKYSNLSAVGTPAELRLPRFTNLCRVLNRTWVFKHATWRCAVRKELSAELLGCNCKPDSVLRHCNRRVTNKSVKPKSGNMQDIARRENDFIFLAADCFVRATVVFVVQRSIGITVNRHSVRHKRVQSNDLALSVADNLRVCVAPEEQVRHKRFSENKRGHFGIGFIVQQAVKRMRYGFLLAGRSCPQSIRTIFVNVQG